MQPKRIKWPQVDSRQAVWDPEVRRCFGGKVPSKRNKHAVSLNGSYQSHYDNSTLVVFYGCFAIFCAVAAFFRHQLLSTLHFQSGLGFYLEIGLSLIFFLGTLFARPTPPPVAEAVLERSRALQVLSQVSWFVLLAGSWMALTRASSMLLVSSLLSSYLAVGLVGTGWWVWLRMSPPDQVTCVEEGVRAPLIPTHRERALELAIRVGLPLLMLILLVGLPLARNEYRLSLLGVSASAGLSFPAYL